MTDAAGIRKPKPGWLDADKTKRVGDVVQATQYLDWGDVTRTLDPMRNQQWIYDSDTFKHGKAVARGLALNHVAFSDLQNWDKSDVNVQPFHVTSKMLDDADKMSEPRLGSVWRGYERDTSRFGKLPVITQKIYDNSLPNKSRGDIEHEMRESDRRAAGRVYDRTGNWR